MVSRADVGGDGGKAKPSSPLFFQAGVLLSFAVGLEAMLQPGPPAPTVLTHPSQLWGTFALHSACSCHFHDLAPALHQPRGSNPCSTLRTGRALQSQCRADSEPATGNGHPRDQACCCQGPEQTPKHGLRVVQEQALKVGVRDTGTAAVLERPVLIAHPSSYVATA